jgi:uncharacterized protein YuzE
MASLEFDSNVNAFYLKLGKGKVASSEPLAENVILDLDGKDKVIGLELLLHWTMSQKVTAQFAPATSPSQRRRKIARIPPTAHSLH